MVKHADENTAAGATVSPIKNVSKTLQDVVGDPFVYIWMTDCAFKILICNY